MSWFVVPPEWLGETVFILGCGPSLVGFHAKRLHNYGRVIVINDSYQLAPEADVLYFCDLRWYKSRKRHIAKVFRGRMMITLSNEIPGVRTLRCTGDLGLEKDPGALRHGSNSGFQAIHLAYHFGAKRIVLLGYDMRVKNGKLHWNARPELQDADSFGRALKNIMLPKFASIAEPLHKEGIEVLNATPNSALTLWPYVPIEKILCNFDYGGVPFGGSPSSNPKPTLP